MHELVPQSLSNYCDISITYCAGFLIDRGRRINSAGPVAMSSESPRAGRSDDHSPKMRSLSASVTLSMGGCSSRAIPSCHYGVRALTLGRLKFMSGQACIHLSNMDRYMNLLRFIVLSSHGIC